MKQTQHFAHGAFVKVSGMSLTSSGGGAMCAYSLSAAMADGVQFKGKMEPKRKCWTTGNLLSTSLHHILYMPLQILLQLCAPLMSYSMGLVS